MPAVRELVKHFDNLLMSDTSHEYAIGGIADPFLQVKILQLLRILGKGHKEASDRMSDVLSQVATNANLQKNVVHSILYEAVLTIMEIESSKPLKLLSIDILGTLLAVKDNNIKYVALVTLSRIYANNKRDDITALQHHSVTIMDCLCDSDISIRKRALDLSFAVATPHNIMSITDALISFIRKHSSEIKSPVVSRLCQCLNANNLNNAEVVEATCKIIEAAGSKVEDEIVHFLIKKLASSSQNLQLLATYWLYSSLRENVPLSYAKTALVKACLWCIGEYGNLITSIHPKSLKMEDRTAFLTLQSDTSPYLTEKMALEIICDIVRHLRKCADVNRYVLTCAIKLSTEFTRPESQIIIKEIIEQFLDYHDFEVQQRACEYNEILKLSLEARGRILSIPKLYTELKREDEEFQWTIDNKGNDLGSLIQVIVLLTQG